MATNRTTFALKFFINRTKQKANGECPILLRISINGESVAVSASRTVNPDYWDAGPGAVKPKAPHSHGINLHLETMRAKAFNKHTELINMFEDVTSDMVRDALLGINTGLAHTLMTVWNEHVDNLKQLIGKGTSYANFQKFTTCKRYMAEFLQKEYKCNDVHLKSIDRRMVTKFDVFLRSDKNCSYNTTIKYLQNFKNIILIALRNGWMKTNPFTEFKLSLKAVDRPYLDEEELQRLMLKNFGIKRLEQVRDIFVFSCFTGLSYSDMKKLNKSEIEKKPDGSMWIRSKRVKTGVNANIPLLQIPQQILEKYSDFQTGSEKRLLLPVTSNQKLNSYLKEIADVCEIHKNLSFHIARHTFATTVTLMNGVPMESVSKMLGHTNLRSTQHYARIVDKKVGDDMRVLGGKIDGRLGMAI